MLATVVEDFARCPGVEPVTLLHPRLLPLAAGWPAAVRVECATAAPQPGPFRALSSAADFTLVIAPECGGILANHCRWVEEAGGRLLGPSAAAAWLTADKLELCQGFLGGLGIPTPPTWPFVTTRLPPWPLPWVCKPRDGAGSQATFRIDRPEELQRCRDRSWDEGWRDELILQPYVSGQPASVACLVGPGQCLPLPAAEQKLSTNGRFRYEGGCLPLSACPCRRR
jgi:predicted ATP-grasp superfamily ATP-dependent carboligase